VLIESVSETILLGDEDGLMDEAELDLGGDEDALEGDDDLDGM